MRTSGQRRVLDTVSASETGSRPERRRPHIAALVLVTGTGALATDAYVASLPAVQASLHTTSSTAQLTMTAFLVGSGVGQLVSGPISDARGRRRLILTACLAFAITSGLCAIATSSWLLVAERLLEGAAAGTAAAVGLAVVNDAFTGKTATATFGTVAAVGLVAPVVAPPIGSALVHVSSWRGVFWFLAGVGVVMWLAAASGLPETLPPDRRHPGGFRNLVTRAGDLLSDRHFATPLLTLCLTIAGFFVYIGGSSFVLQDDLGITAGLYTAVFTTNAVTMVATSVLFRVMINRYDAVLLRWWAIGLQTTAVTALFLTTVIKPDHRPPLLVVWVCLSLMTAGLGMFLPASSAIVQHAGRRAAGTSAALGGGLPFLVGACTTPLTGVLGSQTVLTMTTCMVILFFASMLLAVLRRTDTRTARDDVDTNIAR